MYGKRNGKGVGAYKETNVITADPKRLVILCYEGAISSLKIARAKYLTREYEAKGLAVQKAQDIISQLIEALDFEKGGEIAKNLNALYKYMQRRIAEGDLKRDLNVFDEVIRLLEDLLSAWQEAFYGSPVKEATPVPKSVQQGVQMTVAHSYA